MGYDLKTRSGHNMFTMASLLQKAIRRADKIRAGYAAYELFGGYHSMLWNRIMTVSCEDCWGIVAKEITALRYIDDKRNEGKKGWQKDTRYVSQAISLLCDTKKSRDACYYACNFVLQTYVKEVQDLPKDFIDMHRAEMKEVKVSDFDIGEIAGEVEEWNVDYQPEPKQMTFFDFTENKGVNSMYESTDIYASLLRKAIRTLDMELAGYSIHYLRQSDMGKIWATLYAVSRNECKGIPTREIVALKRCDEYVNKKKPIDKRDEIYICKGVMILMYQISNKYENVLGNDKIEPYALIDWHEMEYIDIKECYLPDDTVPEWVYDVHTIKGKKAGKTDWEMNIVEFAALSPLQSGFFDEGSWQPRYEYKHLHGLCTEKEYQEMLEFSKTRQGNPVEKIQDKF